MEKEPKHHNKKTWQYLLWGLAGYTGVLLGYHAFSIIRYFLKPVSNPMMPLELNKYIAFPYLSFIPPLLFLLFLGFYFIKKEYFAKGYVLFYAFLILLFHLAQSSLLTLFDGFNPYGG